MLERRSAFYQKPGGKTDSGKQDGAKHDGGGGRGRGGAKRGGGGTGFQRGGNMTRGKGARFNGDPVCYHYNRAAGCSRTAKGAGCDNGNGGVYAHVCSFESGPGIYCLAKHPKVGNH